MRKLLTTIFVLLILIGFAATSSTNVDAEPVKSPTLGGGSLLLEGDPLLVLKKVMLPPGALREQKIQKLLKGLVAIRDPGVRMTTKRRRNIVEAAIYAQEKTGVDAMLMLAVARMESDFRSLVLINPACKYGRRKVNCFADCGMTQHHVRGSMEYVTRRCARLKRDLKYSFYKSGQELARHVAWCKQHQRKGMILRRCVLNRYNQGPFYKTKEKCKRWHNPWREYRRLRREPGESWKAYRARSREIYRSADWKTHFRSIMRLQWKCRHRASYWKKVSCFEYGARNGVKSIRTCRRCTEIDSIRTKFYKTPPKMAPATSFLFSQYIPPRTR